MHVEIGWLGREYGLTTARGEVHRDRATLAVTRAIESFQRIFWLLGPGGNMSCPVAGSYSVGPPEADLTRQHATAVGTQSALWPINQRWRLSRAS